MTIERQQADLVAVLDGHDAIAIAVSGGVDSMVLAYIAHRFSRAEVTAVHAVSPAVPEIATDRVRRHAAAHGWTLQLIDSGEMQDPSYTSNPVNRCFYCKNNLYARVRAVTGLPIASGTNVDDLSDYRPGLEAARQHEVSHPYVIAGIRKQDIYSFAQAYELTDLASLPAQPCLSSRIETGIAVDASSLRFIEAAEEGLAARLPGAGSIRCRITAAGVVAECSTLPAGEERQQLEAWLNGLCMQHGRQFAGLRTYRRGAAFLRTVSE